MRVRLYVLYVWRNIRLNKKIESIECDDNEHETWDEFIVFYVLLNVCAWYLVFAWYLLVERTNRHPYNAYTCRLQILVGDIFWQTIIFDVDEFIAISYSEVVDLLTTFVCVRNFSCGEHAMLMALFNFSLEFDGFFFLAKRRKKHFTDSQIHTINICSVCEQHILRYTKRIIR